MAPARMLGKWGRGGDVVVMIPRTSTGDACRWISPPPLPRHAACLVPSAV